MMRLLVVRHGRTAWNAERRFQGHTDIPLDETGVAQARALGAMLAGEAIDVAVASDLGRAMRTARLVLAERDVPLRADPDWRELRFGDWEGLTWPEIVARHPEFDEGNETKPRTYTPDGGEAFEELVVRVRRAVARLTAETPPGGTALVATHAGPLHALLRILVTPPGETEFDVRFVPASVTTFVRDEVGAWQLAGLNQTPEAPIPTS